MSVATPRSANEPLDVPDSTPSVLAEVLAGQGLSLVQAARRFPPARLGRPVSPSCVWRWCREGTKVPGGRRIRLEACRVSGRWLTSEPALRRFLAAQQPDHHERPEVVMPRPPAKRQRASERAAAELDQLGV